MRIERFVLLLGGLFWATASASPLVAQRADGDSIVYQREVFDYPRSGRADPFRSLVQEQLGVRFEDLVLRGVVFHPDPSRSVAVLARVGSDRRIRARVGERLGNLRVVAIGPSSADLLIEELGVTRRERLEIRRDTQTDGRP